MQVEEQEALQAKITKLEKRLKTAETQCQATTKEIWQMEVELERARERAEEAEQLAVRLEQELAEARQAPDTEEAEARLVQLQTRLDEARLNLQLLEEEKETSDEARRIAEESLLAAEESLTRLRAELEESVEQLRQAMEEAEQAREAGREAQAGLEELRRQLEQAQSALEQLRAGEVEAEQLRAELEAARHIELQLRESLGAGGDETARLRAELDRARQDQSEIDRLRESLEAFRQESHNQASEQNRLLNQIQELQEELEASRVRANTTASGSLTEMARLQDNLQLHQEKAGLLQQRLDQLQQRFDLSEEKATLYQAKAQEAESRLQEIQSRGGAAEGEVRALKDRLERMESRVRDADRIFETSEQTMREAEAKQQESWQRVRDAEMRANQALVENKKLADKLAEHEKRAQESDRETQRLAFQDPLTGLPNINLISQYLEFTVKQCVRYRRVAALLVIDIDRFKVFNEAMGFKAGDELLAKVAERLQQAIRETDSLGRKGEDEFIILLSELNVGDHNHPEARRKAINQHVEVVANRVMQMMGPPFTVQGQKFYLHVSIGIAICPDDGETPQQLLENGDTAMYHVKETGRNRHQFYTSDLRQRQEKRLSLDTQMRSALERGEFEVRYHPIVSLAKGKGTLVGVEALLRWNHRIDGTVGPDYFLSAAEESGMIIPIGQWVLNQTCTQMREWLSYGLRIFASINLSKRQLLQADLVECISRELSQNGIPPEVLYVEIAEGFNTYNPDMMDQVINRLGNAGIRVAIDDFGVGYSNLSKINLAYTRVLKIDRSIIEGCPTDRQSSTVCIAAINLASSLGLLSLAEGVENANQVKFLAKYGCALAQGYYFSEPIPPNEITNIHRSKKTWKI
ncbi:MAG: EAL domain-containing protein [Candidatus Eremiobacteraeota bacterium]|nr:EAL domain-containing protein [Candidatus Eremiobacteraeota bacterium]MCW5866001.1 EAL domain-containing protein [Candidatus Eremiobacteraeota bacterium]